MGMKLSKRHVGARSRHPAEKGERFQSKTATYMILAPKKVRAGFPYAVSVNILEQLTEPVDVEIRIADFSEKTILETKLECLTSGKPVTASLGVVPASLPSSLDRLVIKATSTVSGKVVFEDSHDLKFSADSLSIFIQTDKALYKPGDLVQFRAIVTKHDLTPFNGFTNVKIKNAESTVIKQFKALPLDRGVASGELQLSDDPTLGDWSIVVGVEDENKDTLPDKKSKEFEVGKYVLPKFDVTLTMPPFSTHGEDIPISITSKYTYGKGVRGTGVLLTQRRGVKEGIEEKFTLNEEGTADIVIKYADLKEKGLLRSWGTILVLCATVKETLTEIERNGTGDITIHNDKEKIIIVKQRECFKPGMDYAVLIAVVTMDNKPIAADADRTVHYDVTFDTEDRYKGERKTIQLDEDGTKEIVLKTPVKATNMTLQAFYKKRPDQKGWRMSGATHGDAFVLPTTSFIMTTTDNDGVLMIDNVASAAERSGSFRTNRLTLLPHYSDRAGDKGSPVSRSISVKAFKSATGSFVQLTSDNDGTLQVGDIAVFTVQKSGNFAMNSLTLQVISNGSVVFVKQVDLSGDKMTVSVPITRNMIPKSQVIVYAIRADNNEVLADAANFQVSGVFQNNVTVSIDPNETKPYNDDGVKNEVTVTVNADPDSFVGLLGVDHSVLLLKTGNDVTQSDVEKEMEKYDDTTKFESKPQPVSFRSGLIFDIGGEFAETLMQNSGMLIFTDAYLYRYLYRRRRGMLLSRHKRGRGIRPGSSGFVCRRRRHTSNLRSRGLAAGPVIVADEPPGTQQIECVKPKPTIRSKFPETWIWSTACANADGNVQHKANVPDTISSFIVSAFATNDKTGLGIAPAPAKLKVFRPFFVSLNLPYSIKQGEKFALPVLVFNYGDADQTVTVTLDHNKDFDFVNKSTDKGTKNEKYNERKVHVKGGGGTATVKFEIVPTAIGYVKLLVKAIGQLATDGVEKKLLVEPEGTRVYFNRPMVLDLSSSDARSFESVIVMAPPAEIERDFVKGSEAAEFSVLGDLMGPLLSGLETLVRIPTGCGEQNMILMVPNIVVMRYLHTTGEVENYLKLATEAKKCMEIGYQRQLKYKRNDGSFSAFGEMDEKGSTWLTAYVIRSFIDASDYIFVDRKIIAESISWINGRQKDSGEYEELGHVLDKGMQGSGGSSGVPMTAFVFTALLRSGHKNDKALKYLEDNLEEHKSRPFVIAVTAYALGLANSPKLGRALDILTESAINEKGERHWHVDGAGETGKKEWWQDGPEPAEVETTSYALLSYLLHDRLSDALPCMRWLSSKRNSLGGFSSTQDTVVGISAVSAYAAKVGKEMHMNIDVTQEGKTTHFNLNDENKVVLQRGQLGDLKQPVKIAANGKGMALAQVSWHYNVRKLSDAKPFVCNKTVTEEANGKDITVKLSCKYNMEGCCNMTVMEVEAPSGFKVDGELLENLNDKVDKLKRTETSKGDTLVSMYLDGLDNNFCCLDITCRQLFEVADRKASQIRVFDYYEPHKMLQTDYMIPNVKPLDEQCGVCF